MPFIIRRGIVKRFRQMQQGQHKGRVPGVASSIANIYKVMLKRHPMDFSMPIGHSCTVCTELSSGYRSAEVTCHIQYPNVTHAWLWMLAGCPTNHFLLQLNCEQTSPAACTCSIWQRPEGNRSCQIADAPAWDVDKLAKSCAATLATCSKHNLMLAQQGKAGTLHQQAAMAHVIKDGVVLKLGQEVQ